MGTIPLLRLRRPPLRSPSFAIGGGAQEIQLNALDERILRCRRKQIEHSLTRARIRCTAGLACTRDLPASRGACRSAGVDDSSRQFSWSGLPGSFRTVTAAKVGQRHAIEKYLGHVLGVEAYLLVFW